MNDEFEPRLIIGATITQDGNGRDTVDPSSESGTDITDYLTNGGLSVTESAVYSDGEFVNVLGETRRTLTGTSVRISASLSMVPVEDAADIVDILSREKVGIICCSPVKRGVPCGRPDVTSVLMAEDTAGLLYYNISFTASGIIPLDGL